MQYAAVCVVLRASPDEKLKTDDMGKTMSGEQKTSQEVLIGLRRIIRAIDIHSRYLAKTFGLTGPQLVLLREIADHDGITIGHLANQVSLSQATVTSIIDRLESKNLAVRRRSENDRRKVTLTITENGRAVLDTNPTFFQEAFVREFERLEQWEQTQILSSVQRLSRMMASDSIADELSLQPAMRDGEFFGAEIDRHDNHD